MKLLPIICLGLCIALTGCKSTKETMKEEALPEVTVDSLYEEGISLMEKKEYEKAIKKFEMIEQEYPYSKKAAKSQIMTATSQYRSEEYDDAILTIERFLKVHPGNKDVAHAYYIKALSFYDRILDIGRDQENTQQAYKALNEVIRRFPKSSYARDAELKLDLVRDHLAGKEMEVGRFYLKQFQYIAAINRFKKVVEEYDKTNHVPEALHRLVEAYLSMGVVSEAKKYAAVLGHNFPDNKWYQHSFTLMKEYGIK